MTEKITKQFLLTDEHAHERLDLALAKLMPEFSRSQIKLWLDDGAILVNNNIEKAKYKVKGGESITVAAQIKQPRQWEAQAIPLNIVHEDDALLVINKPAGLVVHPGAGNADQTLLNALLHHAPQLHDLPRAGILHRLDKDTSGLLVIAKTPAALKDLTQQLKLREIEREYQAVAYGSFISGGHVDAPIDRHPIQRKKMAVVETGKEALTHYRVKEKFRNTTWLTLKLETGRTHQIRVHLAHIHHPIVGDALYGGRVQLSKGMSDEAIAALRGFKRQALHAFALGLLHPDTQEFVRWEIPLPNDMQTLITALQKDKAIKS